MLTETTLPKWNTDAFYPGLDSAEFLADVDRLESGIADLTALFDRLGIRRDGELTPQAFEEALAAQNAFSDLARVVGAFIYQFVSTDTTNAKAQALRSRLEKTSVQSSKLSTRLTAWIGTSDVESLIASSPVAAEHAFPLRHAHRMATHQMSAIEEDLAATLAPAGVSSWSRLHANVTSRMSVEVDGTAMPMSSVRALAHDPDAGVRERAYRAELAAWPTVAVPLAGALNSIKGWTNALNERRGWADPLEPALASNHTDRATLEAMHTACVEAFADLRGYLRAKAKLLGHSGGLPWWDLFAPVGGEMKPWSWEDGRDFVIKKFATYSDKLSGLARRAYDEDWIDAEPRPGKVDGGFCMGVRRDESRILVNFKPSFGAVTTISHELGHAYHNTCLASRLPSQRSTPMALAETASIFCETIANNAMLSDASPSERLGLLDLDLQHATQIVVDIHSRFLFESALFAGRKDRELSIDELSGQMLDAQRQTYGDGLDAEALHPFMWAVKPHYYGSTFYNWPYTFGMLFGLGLYSSYRSDPEGFRAGYDDLLSSTGLEDAATLASRFGIDVRRPDFWRSSLDVVREQVRSFEELIQDA